MLNYNPERREVYSREKYLSKYIVSTVSPPLIYCMKKSEKKCKKLKKLSIVS